MTSQLYRVSALISQTIRITFILIAVTASDWLIAILDTKILTFFTGEYWSRYWPKWRWKVTDIYLAALQLSIYPLLSSMYSTQAELTGWPKKYFIRYIKATNSRKFQNLCYESE